MKQEKCLFNEDYLNLFDNKDKITLKELATKSFLLDGEFDVYKEILQRACNSNDEKIREYMFKGFWKIGKYTSAKWEVPKMVCTTRCNFLYGEEWDKNYPNEKIDITQKNVGDIQISNYGRIRTVTEVDGKKYFNILNQYENYGETYKDHIYYYDGWLFVDLPEEVKINNISYSGSVEVYKLVAEYWLNKPENFNPEDYAIHHINNNGYENTPANLIYLTNEQHNKVHNKG